MMKFRMTAAVAAAICALTCVSCKDSGKEASLSVSETNSSGNSSSTELSVGELVTPTEGSEEYNLGQYRVSSRGVKLYYDDTVSDELMLALETYFLTFENNDFETYKTLLFPDYAERYEQFLQKEYEYSLDNSFKLNCEKLQKIMSNEMAEHAEAGSETEASGEFRITRIKAQYPDLSGDTDSDISAEQAEATEATTESIEELEKKAFSYFTDIFDMDYYEFVKNNSDRLEYLNFYIYASDATGEEHPLIGDIDIVFAVKDGKYYTFG